MPGCGDIGEGGSSTASYRTENGTAIAGGDYTHVEGTTEPMCDDIDSWEQFCEGVPRSRPINLSLAADGVTEDLAVETLRVRLTTGSRGISGGHPNPAPVYVIDANGVARASLEPGAGTKIYPHIEAGRIRLPVFLAGATPPSSVAFKIEGEGPKPSTPGADFTCAPACPGGTGSLPIGFVRMAFVQVNFVRDDLVEGTERMRLSITSPAVAPGEPASTVIEIIDLSTDHAPRQPLPPSEERGEVQVARPAHPRAEDLRHRPRRKCHRRGQDRIPEENHRREVRLVERNEFGRPGKNCGTKRWLPMTYRPVADFYFLKIKPLAATFGTKIKSYTAWTGATDAARNVETTFTRGRNLSTFKVDKKR